MLAPRLVLFAAVLAAVTFVLLAAHRFQHRIASYDPTSFSEDRLFNLSVEGGFGERFELVLLLTCTLVAADVAWRRRSRVFAVFAAIFLLALADGSLGLHERFGVAAGLALGIHPDVAQLLWFAVLGAVLLAGIFAAYRRSSSDEQAASLLILATLMMLGGFAVVVDAAQSTLNLPNLVEDGGELATIAALCFLMIAVRRTLPPLSDQVRAAS